MATADYLVHQEDMLIQTIDNVKDLQDALTFERRSNDGEVSKSTRDFWSILLVNAVSLHHELGKLIDQAQTEFTLAESLCSRQKSAEYE